MYQVTINNKQYEVKWYEKIIAVLLIPFYILLAIALVFLLVVIFGFVALVIGIILVIIIPIVILIALLTGGKHVSRKD